MPRIVAAGTLVIITEIFYLYLVEVTGVTRDTIVFEAFLRMFVETTGHYTEFMNTQQDGELVFQVMLSFQAFLLWM